MDRKELLSQWKRYPSAPKGCQSLSRWRQQPGWVGGRVMLHNGSFVLQSEPNLSLVILSEAKDLDGLQTGDHVAVDLTTANADGSWQAREVRLLVPAEHWSAAEWDPRWQPFLNQVRDFFLQKKFIEIETPSLTVCPGLEPALEPFATELKWGSNSRTQYLPTSPEIHLKKALCDGFTDIFEIKTVYRNGEISEHHQPEFHMLEWYRGYADLELVIEDLCELVQLFGGAKPTVTTFCNLFQQFLGVDLKPKTSLESDREWCGKEKLHFDQTDTATDLFHRLWIDRIEPRLQEPLIVRDFPPEQAALARIKEDGWADRFEFFWNKLEIANAFHEVNDPKEQAARWQMEKFERHRLRRTSLPHDEELLEKMRRSGLPPTGGIALGLERLFMAAHGLTDIRRLKPFPYKG